MRSPYHRPALLLRVLVGLGAVVALLFNAVLMLSDRAPSALRRLGGDAMRRLFARIDVRDRADAVLNDPRLPESDAIIHVAVWALAVVLVGCALWSWTGLVIGALVVFIGSLAVESLQGRLSTTRHVEASDVRANFAGVVVGTLVVAVCYVAYSALASLFGGRRASGDP